MMLSIKCPQVEQTRSWLLSACPRSCRTVLCSSPTSCLLGRRQPGIRNGALAPAAVSSVVVQRGVTFPQVVTKVFSSIRSEQLVDRCCAHGAEVDQVCERPDWLMQAAEG